jgi:ATP-binding cassette, subfamily C (CFTR/MRP), member 1
MFLTLQVSSDLSILDFDVPYTMTFVITGTIEVAATMIIMIVVTWQVVLVAVPAVVVLLYIEVNVVPGSGMARQMEL